MMEKIKNKNGWIIPIYGIFYMVSFFILENTSAKPHVIHCALDDKIPFCEYFIIPYFLWFVFVGATVIYFLAFNESTKEYSRLISMLGTGMTMFLIVSFVWPNCQKMRPDLSAVEGGFFINAVKLLYTVDTSTNIFPSIHVFNTFACMAALHGNERCKKNKPLMLGIGVLGISIVLSTLFLKQHSVVDASAGAVLFAVCYWLFYKIIPENQERLTVILSRDQICTIPNMLSMFRLVLAILFWGIGVRSNFAHKQTVLLGILLLSALTDFLDGQIARKYNMVSEFGKLLDPAADKVTQGVLLLYLVNKYPLIQLTLILFAVKEFSMLLASVKVLRETKKNEGAKWYGKVSTAVFYGVMVILVLFPNIPLQKANFLIGCSSFCMAGAFVMYMNQYITEYQTARRKFRPAGMD